MSNPYPTDPNNPYANNPSDPYQKTVYSGQPPYEQPPYGQPAYGSQPPYGSQPAYGSQPPYGQPLYGQPPYGQPVVVTAAPANNGKAIAALVLGLGLVLTACGFLFFLPFATLVGLGAGIPGVILGHKALKEINLSGGTQGGKGMAVAGLVLSYIEIATGALSCLVFAVAFIALTSAQ